MDCEFIVIELGDFSAKFWAVDRSAERLESFSIKVFVPCIVGGGTWVNYYNKITPSGSLLEGITPSGSLLEGVLDKVWVKH
jgi:hypothetical protein